MAIEFSLMSPSFCASLPISPFSVKLKSLMEEKLLHYKEIYLALLRNAKTVSPWASTSMEDSLPFLSGLEGTVKSRGFPDATKTQITWLSAASEYWGRRLCGWALDRTVEANAVWKDPELSAPSSKSTTTSLSVERKAWVSAGWQLSLLALSPTSYCVHTLCPFHPLLIPSYPPP